MIRIAAMTALAAALLVVGGCAHHSPYRAPCSCAEPPPEVLPTPERLPAPA